MTRKHVKNPLSNLLSNAVVHDHKYSMEMSGQIGLDFETGKVVEGLEAQTKKALDNMKSNLAEVGWDFSNVTRTRIFVVDMNEYGKVNDIYAEYLKENAPARSVVAVSALPLGALVEIECDAAGDEIKE